MKLYIAYLGDLYVIAHPETRINIKLDNTLLILPTRGLFTCRDAGWMAKSI